MKSSRPVIFAAIGGAVLVAGAVAFGIASATKTPSPSTVEQQPEEPAPTFDASQYSGDQRTLVYPEVTELGLVPEPITTDETEYAEAAVAAFGTYDATGKTTVAQWKQYLESWQNVYPLKVQGISGEEYEWREPEENPVRRVEPTAHRDLNVIGEKMSGTVPEWEPADWDMIRSRQGKVMTQATSVGEFEPFPMKSFADFGERQAVVEFTQWITLDDGTDGEHTITFTKHGTALVNVNCAITQPAPDSAQKPGDCKLMSLTVQDYQ